MELAHVKPSFRRRENGKINQLILFAKQPASQHPRRVHGKSGITQAAK
jgi:hypothetical protein